MVECKIYLTGGEVITINNIVSIKAVPRGDLATIALYNDDNTQPVASFFGIVGYQLINRQIDK